MNWYKQCEGCTFNSVIISLNSKSLNFSFKTTRNQAETSSRGQMCDDELACDFHTLPDGLLSLDSTGEAGVNDFFSFF